MGCHPAPMLDWSTNNPIVITPWSPSQMSTEMVGLSHNANMILSRQCQSIPIIGHEIILRPLTLKAIEANKPADSRGSYVAAPWSTEAFDIHTIKISMYFQQFEPIQGAILEEMMPSMSNSVDSAR